ncbi:MAG: hypothetical protein ACRDTE_33575 [Pseudonocardiaceae bacterium]
MSGPVDVAIVGAGPYGLSLGMFLTSPGFVGHSVRWAEPEPWGVRLGLQVGGGDITEITAEHVLAATGYRADLSRLTFRDRRLRSAVRTLGAPR